MNLLWEVAIKRFCKFAIFTIKIGDDVMERFWQVAISVGGLAAVSAFVLWSLYKDWLKLPIFSQLSPDHTFALMLVFLSLTFLSSMAMLAVYIRANFLSGKGTDKENTISSGNVDLIRRKYLLLGYTLQVYMAMFLDENVMKNNMRYIIATEKQIGELMRLVELDLAAPNVSRNQDRNTVVSVASTIDEEIKTRLEVIDASYRAYYMYGRWLGLCLASVAVAKIPDPEKGKAKKLLGLLLEKYKKYEKYSGYFNVSQEVKSDFHQIYKSVNNLYEKGEVQESDYSKITEDVLGLLQKLD